MADLLRSLAARALGRSPKARPVVGTRFGSLPRLPGDWPLPDELATPATGSLEEKLLESPQKLGTTES